MINNNIQEKSPIVYLCPAVQPAADPSGYAAQARHIGRTGSIDDRLF